MNLNQETPRCGNCGAPNAAGVGYCPSCGAVLAQASAAPQATPQQQWAGQPQWGGPPQGQQQWGGPPPGHQQWAGQQPYGAAPGAQVPAFLRRNWVGIAVTALVSLGVGLLLSLVVSALLVADPIEWSDLPAMTVSLLAALFGGNFVASGDGDLGDSVSAEVAVGVHAMPFVLTIAAMAVAVFLFRRMIARYDRVSDALVDAVLVGLLQGLVLLVLSFIFRWELAELADAVRGLGLVVDSSIGASHVGAFLGPLLLTSLVLVVTALMRRDWLAPRLQTVRDLCAPAIRGFVAFCLVLPITGLVGYGLLMFGERDVQDIQNSQDVELRQGITLLAVGTANAGAQFVSMGAFGSVGFQGSATVAGETERVDEMHRVDWFASEDGGEEPGLWGTPVLTLLALTASALAVALSAASREAVTKALGVWLSGLLVFLPLLLWLTSLHLSGSGTFEGGGETETMRLSYHAGPGIAGSTSLLFLAALVIAVVIAATRGSLDLRAVAGKLKTLQAQQGQYAQQPQQWGGQPPYGQQQPPPGQYAQQPPQWGQQPPQGQPPYGQQPPQD